MAKKDKEPKLEEGKKYRLQEVTTKETQEEKKKEPFAKLDLDSKTEELILDVIFSEIDGAPQNEEREAAKKHWEYCRKRYKMEDLDTDFPYENASKRRTGMTTMTADRLLPRIRRALFGSGRTIQVFPEENTPLETAQKQELWLDSTFRRDLKVEENSPNLLYDAAVLNFGVAKNTFVFEEKIKEEVTTYETVDELLRNYPDAETDYPEYVERLAGVQNKETGQWIVEPEPLTLRETYRDPYIGGKFEWVAPEDVIFPKGTKDEEKAWMIAIHCEMREDEIRRKGKDGFFENVDEFFKSEDDKSEESKKSKDYGKKYDIYEVIINFDINGDKLEEQSVLWVGKSEGGKKIRFRSIKYPYSHGEKYITIFRSTEHRYGLYTGGLGEKLRSINCAEDRQVNQIANAWDLAVMKPLQHIKTAGSPFDPNKHKLYPLAIIDVAVDGELKEINLSDIPSSSLSLLEYNRREGELLGGAPLSLQSGQVSPQDPTAPAKKSELLVAESSVSTSEYVKNIARGFVKIAYQTQENYYQFTTENELSFKGLASFEKIPKQEMRAKTYFSCQSVIDSVMSREKAQSYLGLLNQVGQSPLMQRNWVLQWYLWKDVIRNWDENLARDADTFMTDEIRDLLISQIQQAEQLAAQKEKEKEIAAVISEMEKPQGGQGGG